MRLLFVLDDLGMGGAEKVNLAIANGLASRGHHVEIFLRRSRIHYPGLLGTVPLHVVYPDLEKLPSIVSPNYLFKLLGKARSFDVLIGGLEFSPSTSVYLVKLLLRKKVISCVHSLMANSLRKVSKKQRALAKIVYPKVDCVVTPSQAASASLRTYCTPAKSAVIRNPIDLLAIRSAANTLPLSDIQEDPRTKLLFCGRLDANKNLLGVLVALQHLGEVAKKFLLVVLGEGEQKAELEEFTRAQGLQGLVRFVGRSDVPYAWMRACDLLVSTSFSEAAPMVICEAMAAGLPCVSYAIPGDGRLEFISNNETGYLVSPDPLSLAAFLRTWDPKGETNSRIIRAAGEFVAAFALEEVLDAWEVLLCELTAPTFKKVASPAGF